MNTCPEKKRGEGLKDELLQCLNVSEELASMYAVSYARSCQQSFII